MSDICIQGRKPATRKHFFKKQTNLLMNEEILCIANQENTAKNEQGNDSNFFPILYLYIRS